MSRESKSSMKKKSKSESPSRETVKKNPSGNEDVGKANDPGSKTALDEWGKKEGVTPLPPTPPKTESITDLTERPTEKDSSKISDDLGQHPSSEHPPKEKKKDKTSHTPKKGGGGTPRGGHSGSKSRRGEMKFGERPSAIKDDGEGEAPQASDEGRFDASKYQKMTALYFHKYNDLSRSARGVGYTPDQAVSRYGPGVTGEAESLYGPCRLLTDFQYSTWTETVVPLRNHNVVQGFNEMILFLIKLAANPDGPVNHEEAFMATSFLANIRNDLGEHPPNVLALLEYIDYKTMDDGTEVANPGIEVIPPCKASERY